MTAKVVYTSLKRKRSSSDGLNYHSSAQDLNLVEKPYCDLVSPCDASELSQSTLSLQGSLLALTTPSSESSGFPLTSENLHMLEQEEGRMASFSTPQKSLDTSRSTSSLSKEVGTVREILYLNGLSMDDPAARKMFRQGIDEARDLVTEPHHSAHSKQLLDEIDETRLDYSDCNETTFTNRFFGVFQSKSRHVKLQAEGDNAQPDNDEEIADQADSDQGDFHIPAGWAARDWADDGLDENDNRVFQAGSVPRIGSANENHKAILNDLPRISNPQPDIIHGTSIKKHYTDEERAVIAQFSKITQVSMGLACPFLGVEVKTKGDIEEAANQACPEGASMVAAHRNLEVLARPAAPKTKGTDTANAAKAINTPAKCNATPRATKVNVTLSAANVTPKSSTTSSDPNSSKSSKHVAGSKAKGNAESNTSKAYFSTKAYTMVLTPKYAQINVHWVQIGEGEGEEALTYHMHCVKSYALNEQDNLKACCAAVNNILDWGLGERDKKIKALLNQVHDRYKVLKAAKAKGKEKDKSVDKSPESKKRRMDEIGTGDSEIWQAMWIDGSGRKV
ncbi:MAG: hypothetical protein Q9197_003864 [Variospora fuerteventurae]